MSELTASDQTALRDAKALLEHPGVAIQIANWVGVPLEQVLRLPLIGKVTDKALRLALSACSQAALKTLRFPTTPVKSHNGWHKFSVTVSGAVGGFFGIAGASAELPFSTTTMLRSILDIARSKGEAIDAPETRVACLEVLALGGSSRADDAADASYFAVRAALAKQVSAAVDHLATRGLAEQGAPAMVTLISRVSTYFAIPVSEKLAVEAAPFIGAASGAAINLIFMSHFQRMAESHFTIRRLERTYGRETVRKAYDDV